jgi:hypothetical protein
MAYCKYCQDVLKIVQNANYDPETIELTVEGLINILIDKHNAKKSQYIGDDTAFQINFGPDEIDNVDINMKKFKDMTVDMVKNELRDLYEDVVKQNKDANMFNFQCSSCSATYYLQPGTEIASDNFIDTSYITDELPEIRIHDPTLFRTKDYICVKKTCITNTDKSDEVQRNKEAVMYKLGNNHNINYICTACNVRWGT